MPMTFEVTVNGPRRTPTQILRAWILGGGVAGAAVTLFVVAIVLALAIIPTVAAGALIGSLIGAVVGVFRAALAMFRSR